MSLNEPLPSPLQHLLPSDFPALCSQVSGEVGAITGNDVLVLTLHKAVVDSCPRLTPLLPTLLTILQNTAPYTKNLSLYASQRLIALVDVFSSPRFLFSREHNWRLIAQALGALTSLLQHQFESNPTLVYTLLTRKIVILGLVELTLESWEARKKLRQQQSSASSHGVLEETRNGATKQTGSETEKVAAFQASQPPQVENLQRAEVLESWSPNHHWWSECKRNLPLQFLTSAINYLAPRVETFAALNPSMDAQGIIGYLKRETLTGVVPPPGNVV